VGETPEAEADAVPVDEGLSADEADAPPEADELAQYVTERVTAKNITHRLGVMSSCPAAGVELAAAESPVAVALGAPAAPLQLAGTRRNQSSSRFLRARQMPVHWSRRHVVDGVRAPRRGRGGRRIVLNVVAPA
jgi:hypothetical protein